MSETPNLDELRELSRKLQQMLENPEPGLMTWREYLHDICAQIGKF